MKKQQQNLNGGSNSDTNSSTISLTSSLAFVFLLSVVIHISTILLLKFTTNFLDLPDPSKFQNKNIDFTLIKNPDNMQEPTQPTKFKSAKGSQATGKMTTEKGNNPVPVPPGKPSQPSAVQTPQKQEQLGDEPTQAQEQQQQEDSGMMIPEHFEFDQAKAFNISSSGQISFDTSKYENAEYFYKMIDKISSYWHRIYFGLMHSGEVDMLLMLDRNGKLVDYKIVKHFNYPSQVNAIIQAARRASPFGPLPDEFKDQVTIIPVRFQYVGR